MKKISTILILFVLFLSACANQEPTATPEPATAVPTTEEPTEEPTAEPTEDTDTTAVSDEEMANETPALAPGFIWNWASVTDPVNGETVIEPGQGFTLSLIDDEQFVMGAPCRAAVGQYTLEDNALTLTFDVPEKLDESCEEDENSERYFQLMQHTALYFIEDGRLYIDLMADGGTLAFDLGQVIDMSGGEENEAVTESADEVSEDETIILPLDEITDQLDAYLQSQVYTDGGSPRGAAPGLVLYVETPDGVYLNAAGVSNLEEGTPMETTDILEIGSNTKSMTIVLLMQLVEEGLISLDDPLSQYLPDQAALLPNGDQVTIRQMAQHTAGFYDYGDNIIAAGISDPAGLEMGFAPAELVQDAVDNGTPYFAPGEEGQWHYSNTGYILLGMIIESLTGETYGDLIQTRIFDPLGMESAVFLEGVPQEGEITTHGYWWQGDNIVDTTNWNASQGWAAGAAAMTAADLATYGKALAAGELFQNPETLNEMLTFDPAAISMLGTPYGLGLFDVAGDGSVWGHAGQTLGFQSLWFTDPEKEIIVVGLTNSATYSADGLLNVRNILAGNGPLPVGSGTLLPAAGPTAWQWSQFVTPVEATDIDEPANFQILLTGDQGVLYINPDCGSAVGTYTVEEPWQINIDLDTSSLTCDADSLGGQLAQHLNDAVSWYFDNGMLVVELSADGGTMVFVPG